jgi:hypothetical protein
MFCSTKEGGRDGLYPAAYAIGADDAATGHEQEHPMTVVALKSAAPSFSPSRAALVAANAAVRAAQETPLMPRGNQSDRGASIRIGRAALDLDQCEEDRKSVQSLTACERATSVEVLGRTVNG